VPHYGCPHRCTFCNQRYITGQTYKPSAADVDKAVSIAISSAKYLPKNTEIAFFGGSFTAIDREYMIELLEAASKYVFSGAVSGIRISTRPDCINKEILEILHTYGVSAIELGAQSMVDHVLKANKRGHLSADVVSASKLIKESGFELGLQMMTGLYTSTAQDDFLTAQAILKLRPDTVRIYPTIVVKNTELDMLYKEGKYIPQTLEAAVSLCVRLEDLFASNNIKVIRVGLHSLEDGAYIAGPWHPAFREMCESLRYRNSLSGFITKPGEYIVRIHPKNVSKLLGQKKSNLSFFKDRKIHLKIVQDSTIDICDFIIEEVK
jgi:histone acetyltransferase (RNA polymerase elongator complex component)